MFMSKTTRKDIRNSIRKYVNEKFTDYAIMISGEWGMFMIKTYLFLSLIVSLQVNNQ